MGSASLASPVFVVAFSFLLLSRLALHSAVCSPFFCGNLSISHPFNNDTHWECGLSTIGCENNKSVIVSDNGTTYEVKSISKNSRTIVIKDHQLHEKLARGNCDVLNNFQTPIFPTLSFKVKANYTWLKCDLPPRPKLLADFHEYPHCDHPKIFYHSNPEQWSLPNASIPPPNCSVFHFPVIPRKEGDWEDIELSLEWSYPPQCHHCEEKCRRDSKGTVIKCAGAKHGNKMTVGQILGIVFGVVGATILLLALIFDSQTFIGLDKTKNISPSSTMDIEKGGSTYMGVPIFSYDELVEATNNFDSNRALGDGGFGTVYYGNLRDGRVVAVKRLYENTFKGVGQFMNEVEILTRLRHQNLVTLHGCTSRHSHELLLVYEYIPNGTVADHLHGDRARTSLLTWPSRMSIAIETASALSYLHASDIIHRDVKSNNILLDNNFRVRVADFGLSRLFPPDVTHVSTAPQGTPGYVDPEYHQCYQLTDKSDVYSFGVVLIELISSKPAVDTNRHRPEINLANMALKKIQNQTFHELVDPCLGYESDYAVRRMTTLVAELAFRCLQLESEMRPTMDEVLETLRGIENEDKKVEKVEVVVNPSDDDDVGLLKSCSPPLSPDSDKWVSWSTTPSASI